MTSWLDRPIEPIKGFRASRKPEVIWSFRPRVAVVPENVAPLPENVNTDRRVMVTQSRRNFPVNWGIRLPAQPTSTYFRCAYHLYRVQRVGQGRYVLFSVSDFGQVGKRVVKEFFRYAMDAQLYVQERLHPDVTPTVRPSQFVGVETVIEQYNRVHPEDPPLTLLKLEEMVAVYQAVVELREEARATGLSFDLGD
jgi:hypothetical protein